MKSCMMLLGRIEFALSESVFDTLQDLLLSAFWAHPSCTLFWLIIIDALSLMEGRGTVERQQ